MTASILGREYWQGGEEPSLGRFLAVLAGLVLPLVICGESWAQEHEESLGEGQKLTVEEAVERAVERSAFVENQEASVAVSKAERREATRLPNPQFIYDREQWWQEGEVFAQDWFLVGESFELPGTRRARRDAADARVEAARLERERRQRNLRLEIRKQYYELVAIRRRIDAAKAWVERLEEARQLVEKRVEKGRLAPIEVHQITGEHEAARADLVTNRAEFERQKAEFLGRIGLKDGGSEWRLDGALTGAKYEFSDGKLGERVRRRADLRALAASARGAAAEAREARRSWLPSFEVHGGYIRILEPGLTAHGFAVGAGIPLPLFDRNRGEARVAEARRRRFESRRALMRRRLTSEVRGRLESVRKRREAAARFRNRGVKAARDAFEARKSAYDANEATLFELLAAERTLYEAELKSIDLLWAATRAELELSRLLGDADG